MRRIKILGSGCGRCKQLAFNAQQAAEQLGVEYELEKVGDLEEYTKYGLMLTPGLVIDGELKAQGKLPSVDEVKAFLG